MIKVQPIRANKRLQLRVHTNKLSLLLQMLLLTTKNRFLAKEREKMTSMGAQGAVMPLTRGQEGQRRLRMMTLTSCPSLQEARSSLIQMNSF